jgi:ribosomal protein L32
LRAGSLKVTPHERDVIELGECATCGSSDPDDICMAPAGECDECGAFTESGNVCASCARELGGES